MQQRPGNRVAGSVRLKRTRPSHPGVTSSALPVVVRSLPQTVSLQPEKRRRLSWRAIFQLILLGVSLEGIYLALYPLLVGVVARNDPVQQALPGLFPWLHGLYWTNLVPQQVLKSVVWLDPSRIDGSANLMLLCLGLACILLLGAVRVGRLVAGEQLVRIDERLLFWTVLLLTGIFGVTMLLAPVSLNAMSRDMLLYGFYGRLAAVYHVNPFVAAPSAFADDMLQQALTLATLPATLPPTMTNGPIWGPVWIDVSILITIFARDSFANLIVSLRFIALLAHLTNAVLIWAILEKLKPVNRISATLFYAWNPLVLILGIAQMHQEIVVLLCLLLALFCLQRRLPMLSWIFGFLAVLFNPGVLILLPLLLAFIAREVSSLPIGSRLLWWLGLLLATGSMAILAYAPYWQGWNWAGLGTHLLQIFWQKQAVNSLDAALLGLPVRLPPALAWVIAPERWSVVAFGVVAVVLIFALRNATTLKRLLLWATWISLLLFILLPVYWPWYALIPLTLALCATHRSTVLLLVLLVFGALFSYYCWLWRPVWPAQALATLGLPLVIWGWVLFFIATWRMIRPREQENS